MSPSYQRNHGRGGGSNPFHFPYRDRARRARAALRPLPRIGAAAMACLVLGWVFAACCPDAAYALPAPASVSATDGVYADKVSISWGPVSGATHYRVARAASATGTKLELGTWQTGTTYEDRTPTPGVTYFYSVRAATSSGGAGASTYSVADAGRRALSPPGSVSASNGVYTDKVVLSWPAVAGATHYRLARALSLMGAKSELGSWQTARTYTDRTAAPGLTYYYFAKAATSSTGGNSTGYSPGAVGVRRLLAPVVAASDGTFADKVVVSWGAVPGATQYSLECRANAQVVNSTVTAETTFTDTGATAGTVYEYRVQARPAGVLGWSDVRSDTGWRALTPPAEVSASDGDFADKVLVTWTAVPAASYYRVYRAATAGGARTALGTWQTATTFEDKTGAAGVTYYYSVSAAPDAAGARASAAGTPDAGWRASSVPSGVSASGGTFSDKVRVTWSAVSGSPYYRVARADTATGAATDLGTWQTARTYDDSTASPGVTYFYFVQAATNGSGDNVSASSTGALGWRALTPPGGVSASDGTFADRVVVTWGAVPGATHYRVYRAATSGGARTALGTWQTATTYQDTSVSPGAACFYTVSAATSSSGARESAAGAADAGWRALPGPVGVTASDGAFTDKVTITWSPVAGATHYRVARAASAGGPKTDLGSWQTATTFDDRLAAPAVTGYYFVRAAASSAGALSTANSAADAGWRALAPPTGVSATAGTSAERVTVSWTAVAGATHYRVYRCSVFGGTKIALGVWQTAQAFDDTLLTPSIAYYYYVAAAVSSGGLRASGFSGVAIGWRALSAPTGVAASDGTFADKVAITWNRVPMAKFYRVYRATPETGAAAALGTWQTAITYLDTSATPGANYLYYVSAAISANGARESAVGNPDAGWRALPDPGQVVATDGDFADRVRVAWAALPGAAYYRVFRFDPATFSVECLSPWQSATTFDDTTGEFGAVYYYWVEASVDAYGNRVSGVSDADAGWSGSPPP